MRADGAKLSLFYEEPDPDRWVRFDRYPRRVVRRVIRGKRRPGGQERVFLNLRAGLDRLNVAYRVNDYHRADRHPEEIAGIVGKPHLLDKHGWRSPILFGAATFSHPVEYPNFVNRFPNVRRILVPGEWMRQMWEPYYPGKVYAWPVGIDVDRWTPSSEEKQVDFLVYDKVRWDHEQFESELITPIGHAIERRGMSYTTIRYGNYAEREYEQLLRTSRAMIFVCEHETQGIAYQQALSAGVPILAWDRGGYWQDPAFFPHKVKFGPVSSVPYWDERCGVKFATADEFEEKLSEFEARLGAGAFSPRDYILENLTLEKCAAHYLNIYKMIAAEL